MISYFWMHFIVSSLECIVIIAIGKKTLYLSYLKYFYAVGNLKYMLL